MKRLGFVFVVALGLVFGGGVSPASAGDGAPNGSVVLNPSTVEVGGNFTVTLSGFFCDEQIGELRIVNDQQQATVFDSFGPVDAAGSAVETLTAPPTPGTYVVVAIYDSSFCPEGRATLTVVPLDTTPPSTTTTTLAATTTTIAEQVAPSTAATTTAAAPVTLPATGRSTDGLVWIALVTALLGGGLVAVAARRS